jgi:hypothetical protein
VSTVASFSLGYEGACLTGLHLRSEGYDRSAPVTRHIQHGKRPPRITVHQSKRIFDAGNGMLSTHNHQRRILIRRSIIHVECESVPVSTNAWQKFTSHRRTAADPAGTGI